MTARQVQQLRNTLHDVDRRPIDTEQEGDH